VCWVAFEQAFSLFLFIFLPELISAWLGRQIQLIALRHKNVAVKGRVMLTWCSATALTQLLCSFDFS